MSFDEIAALIAGVLARLPVRDTANSELDGLRRREAGRATIAALDAAGLVIVPKEPTEAMIERGAAAGYNAGDDHELAAAIYRAMTTGPAS